MEVNEWKGQLRVDIRKWKEDKPTKKGNSLSLMRWKNWANRQEYTDKVLEEKKSYGYHIGGNVYCNIAENGVCVDIR